MGHSSTPGPAREGSEIPAAQPPIRTLAARIDRRDRHRFVGRSNELAFVEQCLEENPPANVVLIHGAGGIGKSTLLREIARRAEAQGRETFFIEGRELP